MRSEAAVAEAQPEEVAVPEANRVEGSETESSSDEESDISALIDQFLAAIGITEESSTLRVAKKQGPNPLAVLEKCSSTIPGNQPLAAFIESVKNIVTSIASV